MVIALNITQKKWLYSRYNYEVYSDQITLLINIMTDDTSVDIKQELKTKKPSMIAWF